MQEPTTATPPPEPARDAPPTPRQPIIVEVPPSAVVPSIPKDVPLTSIVGEEIGPPTPETGVADVLLGSIALVGALLVASLLLGGLVGAALVYVKHRLGFGGPDKDSDAHVTLAIGRREGPRRDGE